MLSQGWAKKKWRAEKGSLEGNEVIWREFESVNGMVQAHKKTPWKAYRFKGTLMLDGKPVVWCWAKLGMTSGVHNMCGIASMVPETSA